MDRLCGLIILVSGASTVIRKAALGDISAVSKIYDHIHEQERLGNISTGWLQGVYPVQATAQAALERGELYVYDDGEILATAIINKTQVDVYAQGNWLYPAQEDEVMVLHTLVVEPSAKGRGIGKAFVAFYEDLARNEGCKVLRIDTNAKNTAARGLYKKLGFREAGIVPCSFNGIPGVDLVLIEKNLLDPAGTEPVNHQTTGANL